MPVPASRIAAPIEDITCPRWPRASESIIATAWRDSRVSMEAALAPPSIDRFCFSCAAVTRSIATVCATALSTTVAVLAVIAAILVFITSISF